MATGKTWSIPVPITHVSDGKIYGYITVYFQEDYYTDGNYSTIKVTKITGSNTIRAGTFGTEGSISIDGTKWYSWVHGDWYFGLNNSGETSDFVSYNGSTLPSGKRIAHNNDGNKTIAVEVTISSYSGSDPTWYGQGGTASENVALTKTHTHSYTTVVTPPTCTEDGFTTYTCSCGNSYIEDVVPATGHNHVAVVTPPTCTEQGYTTHACSCGDSYVDSYIDAPGHEYDEGVVTAKPVFNREGVRTRTCRICGETHAEAIPMLPSGAIIHNGAGFNIYHAYIHNGTKWLRYALFMFIRNKWKRCWFGPDHPHEYVEPVIPEEPDNPVPDTPTSYLYGREATDGETPDVIVDGVGYIGAVLPKLPQKYWDKETHPYGVIFYLPFFDKYYLYCLQTAPYWTGSAIYIHAGNYDRWEARSGHSYWVGYGIDSETDGFLLKQEGYTLVWTNTDILNEDGTVYMSASEPVPVGKIVGYSYNGEVFPDINEVWTEEVKQTHPYAYLIISHVGIRLYLVDSTCYAAPDSNAALPWLRPYSDCSVKIYTVVNSSNGDYWELLQDASAPDGYKLVQAPYVVWASVDVPNTDDGSVFLEASEPIPVYE